MLRQFVETVESHTDQALWSKTELTLVKLSMEAKRNFSQ